MLAAPLLALLLAPSATQASIDIGVRLFDVVPGRRPSGHTGMLRGAEPAGGSGPKVADFCSAEGDFDGCAASIERLLAEVHRVETAGGGSGGRSKVEALLPEAEKFVAQMFRAPPGSQKSQRKRLAEDSDGGGTKGARRANRKGRKEKGAKSKKSEAARENCEKSFGMKGDKPNAGSQMRCLINAGEHIAAVDVIDGYLREQVRRFGDDWTLLVQRAPKDVPQTMVLSTFALGLLQEWLDTSEEGAKIAAASFSEFSRKAGLMHAYNKQLENLLVYGW